MFLCVVSLQLFLRCCSYPDASTRLAVSFAAVCLWALLQFVALPCCCVPLVLLQLVFALHAAACLGCVEVCVSLCCNLSLCVLLLLPWSSSLLLMAVLLLAACIL